MKFKLALSGSIHTVYIDWKIIPSKTKCKWVKCMRPEGQTRKLRPQVTGIAINLWGRDLLQQ